MPVIRQKPERFTQPINVTRTNTGGAELWETISNNASELTNIVLKKREAQSINQAQDIANLYSNDEITALDPLTNEPKVLSEYNFNPQADAAFEQIIQQRFSDTINNSIQLKDKELYQNSPTAEAYKKSMSQYLAELSNGVENGAYKNLIESVGTQRLSLTHLNFLAQEKKANEDQIILEETNKTNKNLENFKIDLNNSLIPIESKIATYESLKTRIQNLNNVGQFKKANETITELKKLVVQNAIENYFSTLDTNFSRAALLSDLTDGANFNKLSSSLLTNTNNEFNLDDKSQKSVVDFLVAVNTRKNAKEIAQNAAITDTLKQKIKGDTLNLNQYLNSSSKPYGPNQRTFFKNLNETGVKVLADNLGLDSTNSELSQSTKTDNNNKISVHVLESVVNRLSQITTSDENKNDITSALNLLGSQDPMSKNVLENTSITKEQSLLLDIIYDKSFFTKQTGLYITPKVLGTLKDLYSGGVNKNVISEHNKKINLQNQIKEAEKNNNFKPNLNTTWTNVVNEITNFSEGDESKTSQLLKRYVPLWIANKNLDVDDIKNIQAYLLNNDIETYNLLDKNSKSFVEEVKNNTNILRSEVNKVLDTIFNKVNASSITKLENIDFKDNIINDAQTIIEGNLPLNTKIIELNKIIKNNRFQTNEDKKLSDKQTQQFQSNLVDFFEMKSKTTIEQINDSSILRNTKLAILNKKLRKTLPSNIQKILEEYDLITSNNFSQNADDFTINDKIEGIIDTRIRDIKQIEDAEKREIIKTNNKISIVNGNFNGENSGQVEIYNNIADETLESELLNDTLSIGNNWKENTNLELFRLNGLPPSMIDVYKNLHSITELDLDNSNEEKVIYRKSNGEVIELSTNQKRKFLAVYKELHSNGKISNSLTNAGFSVVKQKTLLKVSDEYNEILKTNSNATWDNAVIRWQKKLIAQKTDVNKKLFNKIYDSGDLEEAFDSDLYGKYYDAKQLQDALNELSISGLKSDEIIETIKDMFIPELPAFHNFLENTIYSSQTDENNITTSIVKASKKINGPITSEFINDYRESFLIKAEEAHSKGGMLDTKNDLVVLGSDLSGIANWKQLETHFPTIKDDLLELLESIYENPGFAGDNPIIPANLGPPLATGIVDNPVTEFLFGKGTSKWLENEVVVEQERNSEGKLTGKMITRPATKIDLMKGFVDKLIVDQIGDTKFWWYTEISQHRDLSDRYIGSGDNKEIKLKRYLSQIPADRNDKKFLILEEFILNNSKLKNIDLTKAQVTKVEDEYIFVDSNNNQLLDKDGERFVVKSLETNDEILEQQLILNREFLESKIRDEQYDAFYLTEEEKKLVDARAKIDEQVYDTGIKEPTVNQSLIESFMKFIIKGQSGSATRNIDAEKQNIIKGRPANIVEWFRKNTNRITSNPTMAPFKNDKNVFK